MFIEARSFFTHLEHFEYLKNLLKIVEFGDFYFADYMRTFELVTGKLSSIEMYTIVKGNSSNLK